MTRGIASVAAGLAGGVLGAGVMSAGHALLMRFAGDSATPPATESEEPDSTILVAERVSGLVRHRPLEDAEKPVAANLVHYAFGAMMGLAYGVMAPAMPIITLGAGALYGVAVYAGAHATVVPALGLGRSPLRSSPGKEAREFVLHLAYGITVGLVHRLAIRTSR